MSAWRFSTKQDDPSSQIIVTKGEIEHIFSKGKITLPAIAMIFSEAISAFGIA